MVHGLPAPPLQTALRHGSGPPKCRQMGLTAHLASVCSTATVDYLWFVGNILSFILPGPFQALPAPQNQILAFTELPVQWGDNQTRTQTHDSRVDSTKCLEGKVMEEGGEW